jgi:site-specific DNA-methyltransferase (adenine-specific)
MEASVMILHQRAEEFIQSLENESVELLCTDPPYSGITKNEWDNQWTSPFAYAEWLVGIFHAMLPKLTPTGSIVFFGGLGKHADRPLLFVIALLEQYNLLTYRNWVTWKKRRAYGKSHDYLFCREEILWFSKSKERTGVVFNVPLLDVKRGYAGWDVKHPAKSEYKRVSNVWDDIGEIMRPRRDCEKPIPLMRRIIETHSNPGSLVVDTFVGSGATMVAAKETGRRYAGCDIDPLAVEMTQKRLEETVEKPTKPTEETFEESTLLLAEKKVLYLSLLRHQAWENVEISGNDGAYIAEADSISRAFDEAVSELAKLQTEKVL